MRSYIAVVGLAAVATAQTAGYHAINLPDMNEAVPACSTYNIKWTPSNNPEMAGDVTFELIGGATQQTLVPKGPKFGSAPGASGSFAWDVPCDEGADAIYGLKIFLASNTEIFQYSMPFKITPVDGSVSAASSVSAETTTDADVTPTETETDSEAMMPTTTAADNTTTTAEASEVDTTSMMTYTSSNITMTSRTLTPTVAISTTFTSVLASTDGAAPSQTTTATPTTTTAGASRSGPGAIAAFAVVAAFFAL